MQVCESEWRALSSSPHAAGTQHADFLPYSYSLLPVCLPAQVAELVFCEYFEQGDIERNELHVEPAVRFALLRVLLVLRTTHTLTLTHIIAIGPSRSFAEYCTLTVLCERQYSSSKSRAIAAGELSVRLIRGAARRGASGRAAQCPHPVHLSGSPTQNQ